MQGQAEGVFSQTTQSRDIKPPELCHPNKFTDSFNILPVILESGPVKTPEGPYPRGEREGGGGELLRLNTVVH